MRRFIIHLVAASVALSCAHAEPVCRATTFNEARYAVCEVRADADIRLFLHDGAGAPFGDFDALRSALAAENETLLFAMNAGMYHEDRSPVGLLTINRIDLAPANENDGPGNFHLKPNGVFWTSLGDEGDRSAHVATTDAFLASAHNVHSATQSGPMLVIDGAIHPKFLIDATSRKRRNGVGVRDDGTAVFVISDTAVTFHAFATYFRDRLKTPNALYLDGSISRLYAPELDRNDDSARMGPIVGVVAKNPEKGTAE